VLVGLTSIEEMERANAMVVRNSLQGQGKEEEEIRRDLYVINMDRGKNYYSCKDFGHLAWNCRRWKIID